MRLLRSSRLIAVITLLCTMLFGVVAWQMMASVQTVASYANDLDARRAHETADAALQMMRDKIVALVKDNAIWDEAVRRVYGRIDNAWMQDTWGVVTGDGTSYDAVFVVGKDGRILGGYVDGKPFKGAILDFFEPTVLPLIEDVRRSGPLQPIQRGGFVRTRQGIAAVAVGGVVPYEEVEKSLKGDFRFLIFTQHFTPEQLRTIGRTVLLDEPQLLAGDAPATPSFPIVDPARAVIGWLHWTPRAPGAEAAAAVWPQLSRVIMLVGGLFGGLALVIGLSLLLLGRSESRARTIALSDALTGLPNRLALTGILGHLTRRDRAAGKRIALICLDLDGFKDVNDGYGHSTGDQVIRMLAAGVGALLPPGATLARIGGDEFAAVIGSRSARRDADVLASQILEFLDDAMVIGSRTLSIRASLGIVVEGDTSIGPEEMLRRADVALYDAKTGGKARASHYDPAMDSARSERQVIERDLREGIARGEFDMVYQPIVEAGSGRIAAAEALIRWTRRPGGPISPAQFIPVAESSGLIHTLGLWTLRRACEDARSWDGVRVSVNVSPAQFHDPEFERNVAGILDETGLPARQLELELTEGYLVEHPARAVEVINAIKALGVSVALDDFGTGYSSIGYLRRLSFDRIKIDRSLAGKVDSDNQAAALVQATISLADALSIAVTAEGVETDAQASLLKTAGCGKLQGYLFSRPLPITEVNALLRQQAEMRRPAEVVLAKQTLGDKAA